MDSSHIKAVLLGIVAGIEEYFHKTGNGKGLIPEDKFMRPLHSPMLDLRGVEQQVISELPEEKAIVELLKEPSVLNLLDQLRENQEDEEDMEGEDEDPNGA